jgi:hypothetical protein
VRKNKNAANYTRGNTQIATNISNKLLDDYIRPPVAEKKGKKVKTDV